MLVYIRVGDRDKIICDVDEKDIAEHLQVKFLDANLEIYGIIPGYALGMA